MNVLIALIDRDHVHHERAEAWFTGKGSSAWASCPITQNGVLRIMSGARYPNSLGSPAAVAAVVRRLLVFGDHQFWPDDVSLLDEAVCRAECLLSSRQVTDTYLLALAQAHGGRLATLDRRMVVDATMTPASVLAVL